MKTEITSIISLEDFIKTKMSYIFDRNPDAGRFINTFIEYTHRVDDIIDEKITDSEFILKTLIMLTELHTSNYYIKNADFLFGFFIAIGNEYADSCNMERSNETWKKEHAKVIRQTGINMLYAILYRECGWDTLREFSLLVRESAAKNNS